MYIPAYLIFFSVSYLTTTTLKGVPTPFFTFAALKSHLISARQRNSPLDLTINRLIVYSYNTRSNSITA